MSREINRGDIYYADLDPVIGSEQGGIRPVLVIQNDVGNKHSPTILIAPFTCKMRKKPLPTHVFINSADSGLRHNSMILFEQIRTIDKSRLKELVGTVSNHKMNQVETAIWSSFYQPDRKGTQNDLENKQFYNVKEIQQIMGISRASAYVLVKSKDFPTIRVGARILVPAEQFKKWVETTSGGAYHG